MAHSQPDAFRASGMFAHLEIQPYHLKSYHKVERTLLRHSVNKLYNLHNSSVYCQVIIGSHFII